MPAPGYKNIGIPQELYDRIKKYLDKHPELGYRSVPDLLISATREKMERLERLERMRKAAKAHGVESDLDEEY